MNQVKYWIIGIVMFTAACPVYPQSIEEQIDQLMEKMSLTEKIGQVSQRGTSSREKGLSEALKNAVRQGKVGSLLNVMNTENVRELQSIAVEESPNGIPIIFARDVIHGFKTIFPIPLGQAATWNPELVELGADIAAREASAVGIRWTFAPMLDISRDPRWGRIAESAGEDPYLTSVMAEAYIKGFQGDDLSDPTSMAACAKHFVGYGAAEGGRDYNTAVIHDQLLHNVYLKPFKAAVDNKVATFMTSFNELNGVPASGNSYILQDILRDQWEFDGFVVSDWNSITEMINHGFSKDAKAAAHVAANAGLDMEMTSRAYEDHLTALIAEGMVSEAQLDEMVRNILRIKFRMGLFDDPYFIENKSIFYAKDHLQAAKAAAAESMVLLKNEEILPLSNQKIALIGPLADAPHEQLGTWTFDGEKEHTVTVLDAFRKSDLDFEYASGLTYSRDKSQEGFDQAKRIAQNADVIVFVGGEEAILSGEAHSRANIDLPGAQESLIKELSKTGKPILLVIMAGRPITVGNIISDVDALLFAWHPGTMGGPALVDLMTGAISPSGRLPVSWPRSVGQIPIHYNHKKTGRPASEQSFVHIDEIPIGAWQSSLGNTAHYLDDGFKPLFPFGYGLSYGEVTYDNLKQSASIIDMDTKLEVSARITNTSAIALKEVVQLYFQDEYASITRPVKQLAGFQKIDLAPGESKIVSFTLEKEDFQFYNLERQWVAEPGNFKFWIGPNAEEGLEGQFELVIQFDKSGLD